MNILKEFHLVEKEDRRKAFWFLVMRSERYSHLYLVMYRAINLAVALQKYRTVKYEDFLYLSEIIIGDLSLYDRKNVVEFLSYFWKEKRKILKFREKFQESIFNPEHKHQKR